MTGISGEKIFTKKIKKTEKTLASDVATVKELENPVHETWVYCKLKFSEDNELDFLDIVPEESSDAEEVSIQEISEKSLPLEKKEEKEDHEKRSAPVEQKPKKLEVTKRKSSVDLDRHPVISKEKPQFSTIHYIVGGAILLVIFYFLFL